MIVFFDEKIFWDGGLVRVASSFDNAFAFNKNISPPLLLTTCSFEHEQQLLVLYLAAIPQSLPPNKTTKRPLNCQQQPEPGPEIPNPSSENHREITINPRTICHLNISIPVLTID